MSVSYTHLDVYKRQELCFAEMKDPVQDKLKRFGLFHRLGAEVFFPTIGEAVNTYLKTYPDVAIEWARRKRNQAAD